MPSSAYLPHMIILSLGKKRHERWLRIRVGQPLLLRLTLDFPASLVFLASVT